jgi:aldose 1-epimerase
MIAPSGEQIAIAVGDQRAVIVEVGGGLRSYSASGLDLVDGYGGDEMSSSGRGQVLIPWPNRLEGGSYEFDGKHHQLPLNEPERRNAIHGLVRWAAWNVAEREAHRVVMQHVLHPQPGYPFSLRTSIEYALSDRGLRVRTTTTNVGSERCSLWARRPSVSNARACPREPSCCQTSGAFRRT